MSNTTSPESTYDLNVTLKSSTYPTLNNSNLESTLCFPKDIFYAGQFDVDSFLAHYKRDYSLERLKNDLNIFLKVLELSMSDLINKDYPDFVNLSTNLVDLDKAINDLKLPLEAIKQEVDEVKNSIEGEVNQIMSKLNEKLIIEKKRIVLKLLMNWQRSLKVTNDMIGNQNSEDSNSQKITGDHLERIAFEFCQLKNSLSICSGESNSHEQNNEINKLSQMLLKKMQELFLSCLNLRENFTILNDKQNDLNNPETQQQLKHVMKSYALLAMQRQAEQLFTDAVVKPYMNQYISVSFLNSNSLNINAVFDKIIEFFGTNYQFLKITGDIRKQGNNNTEFDFKVNSVWSTVVDYLDLYLSGIFSPADPDIFHQRYLASFSFVDKFEEKCEKFNDKDISMRLQKSQSYKYFVKKWPIQVYFQIRFQEIVSKIEEDLINYKVLVKLDENLDFDENELNDKSKNFFNLKMTETIVTQMEYCWSESKCYLKPLLSQFWKTNLQIISRYCIFFTQFYQNKISQLEKNNISNNTDQFNLQIPEQLVSTRPKTPTDLNGQKNEETQNVSNSSIDDVTLSVLLLLDVNKLYTTKLPNFFDGIISPRVRSANAMKDLSILKEAFGVSLNSLSDLQLIICDFIVKMKIEESSDCLKNVNDIARLYRRTNREAPKIASGYVNNAIQVIQDFKDKHGSNKKSTRQQELIEKCINNIIDSVCIKYESVSSDLLESVKKMEDSLKRLHRVRQNKSMASNLNAASNVMSDDDKIRLQLIIDITEFGEQLKKKFNGYNGEANYESLYTLAKNAETIKDKEPEVI